MKAIIEIRNNRSFFTDAKPTEFWCEVRDYYSGEKPNTIFYSGPKYKTLQEAKDDGVAFCKFKGMELATK